MRPSKRNGRGEGASRFLWDLLTFERLLTGPVLHLVYWAGLGVIVIAAFGGISAAVTMAVREGSLMGILLGFPAVVAGLLVLAAFILLWRMTCEFYVAVFRISDDLRAIRHQGEQQQPQDRPPTQL